MPTCDFGRLSSGPLAKPKSESLTSFLFASSKVFSSLMSLFANTVLTSLVALNRANDMLIQQMQQIGAKNWIHHCAKIGFAMSIVVVCTSMRSTLMQYCIEIHGPRRCWSLEEESVRTKDKPVDYTELMAVINCHDNLLHDKSGLSLRKAVLGAARQK